jgi:hypothetical protein
MSCVRVEVAPKAVSFHRNVVSGSALRSLKHSVLNKMADAVELWGFMS